MNHHKKLINKISDIIDPNNIITNSDLLKFHNKDWRGFYNFKSICCVFPETTKQVQLLLKYCNQHNIKVVPQGGNTSLTGASVPSKDNHEIIVNLKKMNRIISIDKINYSITLESGCILNDIKTYVNKKNFYFPLNIGSGGSCQLGGNVATNAGGINVLKYGSIKDSILGLEVVLADGSKIDSLFNIKKNNTGYDIKTLFCNSEGTLGIITKVILKIFPMPKDYFHIFIATKSIDQSVKFFNQIYNEFGNQLESAELIPKIALDICIKKGFLKQSFFQTKHETFLLCKFALFEEANKFEDKFIDIVNKYKENYEDIIIAKNNNQANIFWKFREDLVEAYKLEGEYISNDISLPLDNLSTFIEEASIKINKIIKNTRIYIFGHLGDGNIHFNMIEPENFKGDFNKYRNTIYELVNELTNKYGGSFSAEHGIGLLKKDALIKYKTEEEINLMKNIKKTLDPNNILNPGKIIDCI